MGRPDPKSRSESTRVAFYNKQTPVKEPLRMTQSDLDHLAVSGDYENGSEPPEEGE